MQGLLACKQVRLSGQHLLSEAQGKLLPWPSDEIVAGMLATAGKLCMVCLHMPIMSGVSVWTSGACMSECKYRQVLLGRGVTGMFRSMVQEAATHWVRLPCELQMLVAPMAAAAPARRH